MYRTLIDGRDGRLAKLAVCLRRSPRTTKIGRKHGNALASDLGQSMGQVNGAIFDANIRESCNVAEANLAQANVANGLVPETESLMKGIIGNLSESRTLAGSVTRYCQGVLRGR